MKALFFLLRVLFFFKYDDYFILNCNCHVSSFHVPGEEDEKENLESMENENNKSNKSKINTRNSSNSKKYTVKVSYLYLIMESYLNNFNLQA